MNLTSWVWLLVPLGVTRATQIVLHDRLLATPRSWARANLGGYVRYSLGCQWCTSTQLGLITALLLATDSTRSAVLWVLLALSASLVAVAIDRVFDAVPALQDPPVSTPNYVDSVFESISIDDEV